MSRQRRVMVADGTGKRIVRSIAWAGLLGLLAACGSSPDDVHEDLTGDALRIEDAFAVSIPGGSTGAVYGTLVNPTESDDLLLRVSTPAARLAQVHETIDDDGVLRMEAFPEGMPVPANRRTELSPGGKHVMLIALTRELIPGEAVELTFEFRDAGSRTISVPIRDAAF